MNREAVEQAAGRVFNECELYSPDPDESDVTIRFYQDLHLLATSIPILFRALEKACYSLRSEMEGCEGCPTTDEIVARLTGEAEADIEKEGQTCLKS